MTAADAVKTLKNLNEEINFIANAIAYGGAWTRQKRR
jgi:hypothetical protein